MVIRNDRSRLNDTQNSMSNRQWPLGIGYVALAVCQSFPVKVEKIKHSFVRRFMICSKITTENC